MAGGSGLLYTPITPADKAGVVEYRNSDFSWIVDTNAVWSGFTVVRSNRGSVTLPRWNSGELLFQAVCTTLLYSTGVFAIWVNNVYVTSIACPGDNVTHVLRVSGLPSGTVKIIEPWSGRPGNQNRGIDGAVEGGFVTGVYLPTGYVYQKPTCGVGYIGLSDSIFGVQFGGGTHNSEGIGGIWYLLKQSIEADSRRSLSTADYGGETLCGDGLTAANYVTLFHALWVSQGSPPRLFIVMNSARNDWADYGTTVSTTPTQLQTFYQAIINGLPVAFPGVSIKVVVVTPIPQSSNGANGGGFTLLSYETAMLALTGCTLVNGRTGLGINIATQSVDGVHLGGANGLVGATSARDALLVPCELA